MIKYTGIIVTEKNRRHRYFIYVLLLTHNSQCSEKENNHFTGIMLRAEEFTFFYLVILVCMGEAWETLQDKYKLFWRSILIQT